MPLLWTLLAVHLALTAVLFGFGVYLERRATALANRQPEMHIKEDRLKTRIESETDIEQLRATALRAWSISQKDWKMVVSILGDTSNAVLWSATLPAATAMILAFAVYGFRVQKRAA